MIKYEDFLRYHPSFLTLAVSFNKELNCVAENCYSGFSKVTKPVKGDILQQN